MTVTNYDDIDVCNLALGHLSVDPISSLDQNSDVAAKCKLFYPIVRDSLLAKHHWNWAKTRRRLSCSSEEIPLNGYHYVHRLPASLIAGPFAVWGNFAAHPSTTYEVCGVYLYSNYEDVMIEFREEKMVSSWPPYFLDLVAVALAARLSKPILDSTNRADELFAEAYGHGNLDGQGGLFAQAKALDAQSKPVASLFFNGDPLRISRF